MTCVLSAPRPIGERLVLHDPQQDARRTHHSQAIPDPRRSLHQGHGNLRLTNRQGIQLHGVIKGGLKEVIHNVCHSGLSTMGACGDVVRNTMGPAAPIKDAAHADAQKLTEEISQRFLWRPRLMRHLLDGEKIDPDWIKDPEVNPEVRAVTTAPEGEDPIYVKLSAAQI